MSNHMNFVFIGGALTVDFSNTIKIIEGSKTDLLISPSSLYRWTQQINLDIPHEQLENYFQEFRTLRDLIHNCFQDFAYKRLIQSENLQKFNQFIETFKIHPQVKQGNPTFPGLAFESEQLASPLLDHIIQSFLNIVTDESTLDRLKPCENDECVLLFVDKSKNKTRRWCNMATCGNKIKASRFYYRKMEKY